MVDGATTAVKLTTLIESLLLLLLLLLLTSEGGLSWGLVVAVS